MQFKAINDQRYIANVVEQIAQIMKLKTWWIKTQENICRHAIRGTRKIVYVGKILTEHTAPMINTLRDVADEASCINDRKLERKETRRA